MPIGGVVISCSTDKTEAVRNELGVIHHLEIHGSDDQGNIVAVIDTESSEEMEKLIDRINKHKDILNVGMTYINTEDEAERMAKGERLAKPFGFKKALAKNIQFDDQQ